MHTPGYRVVFFTRAMLHDDFPTIALWQHHVVFHTWRRHTGS